MASSGIKLCPSLEDQLRKFAKQKHPAAIVLKLNESAGGPDMVVLADDPIIENPPVFKLLRQRWKNEDEVGWALVNLFNADKELSDRHTPVGLCWTPDACNVKKRMLASSSRLNVTTTLKSWIPGIQIVSLSCIGELNVADVINHVDKMNKHEVHMADATNIKGKHGSYQCIDSD